MHVDKINVCLIFRFDVYINKVGNIFVFKRYLKYASQICNERFNTYSIQREKLNVELLLCSIYLKSDFPARL